MLAIHHAFGPINRNLHNFWTTVLISVVLGAVGLPANAADSIPRQVDVALVLAIDTSGSVDEGELQLQLTGTATALSYPDVVAAFTSGPNKAGAIAYVLWGDNDLPRHLSKWQIVKGQADLVAFGDLLKATRRTSGGYTGIAGGLHDAIGLFDALPIASDNKVIDVSGDGRETSFARQIPRYSLSSERKSAEAEGITINGLAIGKDDSQLADYYLSNVASGPQHFVVSVDSFEDISAAMRRKLIQEISHSLIVASARHPSGISLR
jgi:hypothetical protein